MTTGLLYVFMSHNDVGIDEVPLNGIIFIAKDINGKQRTVIKDKIGSMNPLTTIQWFLNHPDMYTEITQQFITLADIDGLKLNGISNGDSIKWDAASSKFIPYSPSKVISVNNKTGRVILTLDDVLDGNNRRLMTENRLLDFISRISVSDLVDTNINSAKDGDILIRYDNQWRNRSLMMHMLNDVAIHSDDNLEDKILVFQDGYWRAVSRTSAMSQNEYMEKFISSSNQSSFILAYKNLDNVLVSTNGIIDSPGDDYILTDDDAPGTKIIFLDGRDSRDIVIAKYLI